MFTIHCQFEIAPFQWIISWDRDTKIVVETYWDET